MTYKPNNEPVYAVIVINGEPGFDMISGIFKTRNFAEEYTSYLYEKKVNQYPILANYPWSIYYRIEEVDFYE